MENNYL